MMPVKRWHLAILSGVDRYWHEKTFMTGTSKWAQWREIFVRLGICIFYQASSFSNWENWISTVDPRDYESLKITKKKCSSENVWPHSGGGGHSYVISALTGSYEEKLFWVEGGAVGQGREVTPDMVECEADSSARSSGRPAEVLQTINTGLYVDFILFDQCFPFVIDSGVSCSLIDDTLWHILEHFMTHSWKTVHIS